MNRPSSGSMVWWRFKGIGGYHFGYVTEAGNGLIRMGRWNGDTTGGTVVDPIEIEWRDYR
jgi:hypothetical protein